MPWSVSWTETGVTFADSRGLTRVIVISTPVDNPPVE